MALMQTSCGHGGGAGLMQRCHGMTMVCLRGVGS
jgi:hypothetical protein